MAKDISAWKELVASRWDGINVVSSERSENLIKGDLVSDKEFHVKHVIDEQGLDDAIGIDCVVLMNDPQTNEDVIYKTFPMQMTNHESNLYTFEVSAVIDLAGAFKVAYRMYPKHPAMPHRQDMNYVKWFV